MVFDNDHPNITLRGQPKGIQQVLFKRKGSVARALGRWVQVPFTLPYDSIVLDVIRSCMESVALQHSCSLGEISRSKQVVYRKKWKLPATLSSFIPSSTVN
jgi:hypothetical protein